MSLAPVQIFDENATEERAENARLVRFVMLSSIEADDVFLA